MVCCTSRINRHREFDFFQLFVFTFLTSLFARSGSKYMSVKNARLSAHSFACVISAIQVYYAAEMMNVMWICIFGSRYINWTPSVPTSAGTDAKTILNCTSNSQYPFKSANSFRRLPRVDGFVAIGIATPFQPSPSVHCSSHFGIFRLLHDVR